MITKLATLLAAASSVALLAEAFSSSFSRQGCLNPSASTNANFERTILWAAAEGKKKRRRRKQPPGGPASTELESPQISLPSEEIFDDDEEDEEEEIDIDLIKDVAMFKFDGEISTPAISIRDTAEVSSEGQSTAIPLPDIKEVLRKKELDEELAKIEEERAESKVKINRNDRKALAKLLEQQPYADADDSFFEEQEYGTVSALLGERALPFLGIPTGPLQVGHFIGALVIVLMAFVEYPGFPLTNLPTPLRVALQGGLLTVYSINAVLAVFAVFKANERGQPAGLWIAKCFTVGGLAFDQLTQLPTLEQIEKAKARKGKRALKKNK